MTLYSIGSEPDASVYEVLRGLPRAHVPEIIETGRRHGRAYEVTEELLGGTLADLGLLPDNLDTLKSVVAEIGAALHEFAERGLRHRDLRPGAILVRSRDPLDLVVTSFGSARLSEFDLDIVAPLETTRYTAPEAIAGGVAAASDWWSLGMILLEQITRGECFEGINDQAFLINVLTNGAPIPTNLDARLQLLLLGLLARDRRERWGWPQVSQWLDGGSPPSPRSALPSSIPTTAHAINLGGRAYVNATAFALSAASAANWNEARDLLVRGELATWVTDLGMDAAVSAWLRDVVRTDGITEDFRLALALKRLNSAIPLICRGEIVTPSWLLEHPSEGHALLTGPVPDLLHRIDAEPWLARLKKRALDVHERAEQLEIRLREDLFRVQILSTSRSRLEALWDARRKLQPDSDHPALVAILERKHPSEDDLILLLSASPEQFIGKGELLGEAAKLASKVGLNHFDGERASMNLALTRVQLYRQLDERVMGFVRCGLEAIDGWVDQYRIEKRLPIARALVVLEVPLESWREPPQQAYIANIFEFLARRVAIGMQRGPLSRMLIGKSSARLDITELATERCSADMLVNQVLARDERQVDIDPEAFARTPALERRTRLLSSHSTLYRRDTGIDGLYLGFPFLLIQDVRNALKPRIAPLLLWPVRLRPAVGRAASVKFGFDRDREEVRINPALDVLLGSEAAQKWKELCNELLQRQSLSAGDILDALQALAPARVRGIISLPDKNLRLKQGEIRLAGSAVVFHLAYVGQAIAEDLRSLRGVPPSGTAIAPTLRLNGSSPTTDGVEAFKSERFFTADSDPSQEAAVLEARNAPGLVIQGPPGTGKSQTIVNIVADAIGRERSVLVICQKQPALEVVRKRLAAEGFVNRLVMITDVNADRERIVRSIREQLDGMRTNAPLIDRTRRDREIAAARSRQLCEFLDQQHAALHATDAAIGLSFRDLLDQLMSLENLPAKPVDAPELRLQLESLNPQAVASLEESCGSVARQWLPANYEDSPLESLRPFSPDVGSLSMFRRTFDAFMSAEMQRDSVLAKTKSALRVNDGQAAMAWLELHAEQFRQLTLVERARLSRWLPAFESAAGISASEELVSDIETLARELAHRPDVNPTTSAMQFARATDRDLMEILRLSEKLTRHPQSIVERILPMHWWRSRRLQRLSNEMGLAQSTTPELLTLARHEADLRPLRRRLEEFMKRLKDDAASIRDQPRAILATRANTLGSQLKKAIGLYDLIASSPNPGAAVLAIHEATLAAFDAFVSGIREGRERHAARVRSLAALAALKQWFTSEWIDARASTIGGDGTSRDAIATIVGALPSLAHFQLFRLTAKNLDPEALRLLKSLRIHDEAIRNAGTDVEGIVRNTIAREARLAWKARLESDRPELLTDYQLLKSKQAALAEAESLLREANRKLLTEGIDPRRVRPAREWEDITRLRGQRARRLREFLARGVDLGLTALRPVWLMNPDVASRVLPLQPGLFDTVIFDEASQMPVEFAMPAMYRSRVVVVSGDEKQMPPTSFFASRDPGDDDELGDEELLESAGEDDEAALAEWNRREIKDCPDLLQLAKSSLPTTTLKIHYRSSYRELIAFSNASFYRNELQIPVRHPEEKVRRDRPIQVVRIDGVYEGQTNPSEAEYVVDLLEQLWAVPRESRRSCGVVTFNRKQADLIEELLEERAETNAVLREVLAQERERSVDGEDMGFFVKNVENVQGDERDIIVFSTTFGRNSQRVFRRFFGVLGQAGGERRLNVAVTRAKERVVLVTSMPVEQVSDLLATHRPPARARDFLQGYLEYARATSAGEFATSRALLHRLSPDDTTRKSSRDNLDGIVASVSDFIWSLGHRAVALKDSGAFGLDLAIEDPASGLYCFGIECDSPRHPLLADPRARELWRPSLLRRSIRHVHRVSSLDWYANRASEQSRLRDAIQKVMS